MEPIWSWGLELIRWMQQARSPVLDAFFYVASFLGTETFYLLLLPVLLWCVDWKRSARLAVAMVFCFVVNASLKAWIAHPRPVAFDAALQIWPESDYGLPSGHAQGAVVLWGALAVWMGGPLAWTFAGLIMFWIGVSRIYLGSHFPTDVLGGWLVGALILSGFLRWASGIDYGASRLGKLKSILLSLGAPVVFVFLWPGKGLASAGGAMAGMCLGLLFRSGQEPLQPARLLQSKAKEAVLGIFVMMGIFVGLKEILPAETSAWYLPGRFFRYAAVTFWVTWGAPQLFESLRSRHKTLR